MILDKILQPSRIYFILLFSFFIVSCNNISSFSIAGNTMGTTYEVKINSASFVDVGELKVKIDSYLLDINMIFSTYIDNSEISVINRSLEHEILISNEFRDVLQESLYWANISNGLYDPTVYPLVDLWGFAENKNINAPEDKIIQNMLKNISFENISLENNTLFKTKSTHIDLSSLAKGYAVDSIALMLLDRGLNDFMIDIGGELLCSGNNNNKDWIIGVAHPNENALFLKTIINDFSIATSGTYNNYTIYEGVEYSHIINPITGYPIVNSVVSATVLSKSCMVSDAIATMLMVLPYKEGIDIINSIENTECIILISDKNKIISIESDNFKKNVVN
tara:strand:- start:13 stop:1020 length:1008 start_codon:yes stop_codon:yes gene_type:complete